MSFWNLNNFKEITAGQVLHRAEDAAREQALGGVCTDSRALRAGQVFLAIAGEHFNGHDYVGQVVEKKASLVIIDQKDAIKDIELGETAVLLVKDTLAALGQLATAYRKTLKARVIAVTGSVGKTTTKAMIDAVLSTKLKGTSSPKSFNNDIGVPLTILGADPADAYVVAEVGTNAPGEIGQLSKIVQPDIAVITAIGRAHMEGLGTLDCITREKASILSHIRENGLAILNGDYESLRPYYKLTPTVLTYGENDENDLRLTESVSTAKGVAFTVNNRQNYTMPMLGRHNAVNALAAIAVAKSMQFSDEEIEAGLQKATPPEMRLTIESIGDSEHPITLIDDAYNANPESVKAAIDVLCELDAPGRKLIILGDMAELGDFAPDMHRQIGQYLGDSNVDQAIIIGELSLYTAEALARHWSADKFQTFSELDESTAAKVAELVIPGDVALVKASRSMQFERIIQAIRDRFQEVHS